MRMGKKDFRKERKDLYSPKAGISEVDVPRMRFIAITREGTIDNERAQEAAEILFDLSYAVKMSLAGGTQPCGYHDYEIMPLETLFGAKDAPFDPRNRRTWEWTMMVRQPGFVNESLFESLKASEERYHPELDVSSAYLTDLEEGRSVQKMHAGSYRSVSESIEEMLTYMQDREYVANGPLHEIYMTGPGRVEESNLRTILRFPVAPRSMNKEKRTAP